MDKVYGTTFYNWIKDSGNVETISQRIRKIMLEGYDLNSVAIGISWMTSEWPIGVVAEFLIKTFYSQGLDDLRLAQIVDCITRSRSCANDKNRLILTLMVGESAEVSARFISQLTQNWTSLEFENFVSHVGSSLSWTGEFYAEFYNELIIHTFDENVRGDICGLVQKLYKAYDIISDETLNFDPDLVHTVLSILSLEDVDTIHHYSCAVGRLIMHHKKTVGIVDSLGHLGIQDKTGQDLTDIPTNDIMYY